MIRSTIRRAFTCINEFDPKVALLIGIMGIVHFGLQFNSANALPIVTASSTQNYKNSELQTQSLPQSLPLSLHIPNVGIDAEVVTSGTAYNGTLEVPKFTTNVGWYSGSPAPGELGPSVFVGHVDSKNGPAVFWRVGELQPGAKISVDRQDGITATFTVYKKEQFSQSNFPSQKVYGNTTQSELRIITCGGTYDRLTNRYSHNTVVYAVLDS